MNHETFCEFSLPCLRRIVTEVKQALRDSAIPTVPMIVFAKGAFYAVDDLASTEYDVIGLDWTIDPAEARRITREKGKALQGNLDPAALYGSVESIEERTAAMVRKFGTVGLIANLGHDMHPDMNPEHLKAFVNAVHKSSEELTRKE